MRPARTSTSLSLQRVRATLLVACSLLVLFAAGCGPSIDEEFPPGDPTLSGAGDNPVLGSEGPGAAFSEGAGDTTNYGLLALLAVCLIAAGVLLVKVEAWERRRAASRD